MAQQKQKRERLRRGLAVGAGAALLVVVLSLVDVLEPAELISYDWRTQILTREQPPEDSEVVLVMLDEGSLESVLENHGLSWPWPRELWAVMLDFFDHAGAAAVGFDILFPDFSPHGVHDDALFAEKASEYGGVIHSAFFGNGSTEELPPGAPPPIVTTENQLGRSYDRVQLPNEDIIGSAAALGNVHLESDTDQVYQAAVRQIDASVGRLTE
ncbi:MAG: CHASE2 domain-containing protein, partial [Spirochaetota bacterium]